MLYSTPPLTGSLTLATSVEPGSAVGVIATRFVPSADMITCERSFALVVSPQLAMIEAFLSRSNGMTLFGCTGSPMPEPDGAMVPALQPDAVGETSTTLYSMSFAGFIAGRAPVAVMLWKRNSDAGFRTGTAMSGVICGVAVVASATGGKNRSE